MPRQSRYPWNCPGSAVHDAGQTPVAAGALTVVAVRPAASAGEWLLTELARW